MYVCGARVHVSAVWVCVVVGGGFRGSVCLCLYYVRTRGRDASHTKNNGVTERQLIDVNLLSMFTFEASEQSARNCKCFIRVFLLILLLQTRTACVLRRYHGIGLRCPWFSSAECVHVNSSLCMRDMIFGSSCPCVTCIPCELVLM